MSSEPDDLGFPLPVAARGSRITVLVVVVAVIGGAFTFGYLRQRKAHGEVPVVSHETQATRVDVIKPTALKSDRALSLPGTICPLEQTQIYARVTGYVRSWKVDIGDKVTAGELLAEIDTPEADAQLSKARAQLAAARAAVTQATAQRDYSRSSSARTVGLADQQLVSRSQVEQAKAQAATDEATVSSAKANVAAQEANVRRLLDTQQFSKVTAPFAGTVTTRSIGRGTLVREGATTPMFTLVATDPVRVFVEVPQSLAPSVRIDTPATISVREFGARAFTGKVTRSAGALDPELHTMRTEIQVPNADRTLLPGMYVQAAINLAVSHSVVQLPATALYNDAQGVRVATVDATSHVKYATVTIERDTGATVQIATGLTGEERVIKIAIPSLLDGDVVEVAKP